MCASITFQSRQQLGKCQGKHDLLSNQQTGYCMNKDSEKQKAFFLSNPSMVVIVTESILFQVQYFSVYLIQGSQK